MPINQCFMVRENYKTYLNRISPLLEKEDIEKNEACIADYKGWCQGFVVCRSAMYATGQGEWWDEAMLKLSHYAASPRRTITINDKKHTSAYLFELCMTNIRLAQGIVKTDENYTTTLTQQRQYLETPKENVRFEIDVPEGDQYKRQCVVGHAYIGGHFSKPILQTILERNKQLFKENICVFMYGVSHGGAHACGLRYSDLHWFFYDPNDAEGEMQFDDLDACIDAMLLNPNLTPVLTQCELQLHALGHKHEGIKNPKIELTEDECLQLLAGANLSNLGVGSQYLLAILTKAINEKNDELITKIVNTRLAGSVHMFSMLMKTDLIEMFQSVLVEIAPLNLKDNRGRSLLHLAAFNGRNELIQALLQKGLDVLQKDATGHTPLNLALRAGALESAKTLLNLMVKHPNQAAVGELINVADQFGRTPLHLAASMEDLALIDGLIDMGAKLNPLDKRGSTPLLLAILNFSKKEVIDKLIQKGAMLDVRDGNGRTALHWAAYTNRADLLKSLIEGGAALDVHDNRGKTPLDIAIENGSASATKYLQQINSVKHFKSSVQTLSSSDQPSASDGPPKPR